MNQSDILQNTHTSTLREDDEIDLFELWEGLVQEKITILVVFSVMVLLAITYLFTVTPVYKASSYLLAPSAEKIIPMNVLSDAFKDDSTVDNSIVNSVNSVFQSFQAVLGSRQLLKAVFDQYELVNLYVSDVNSLSRMDKIRAENKAFNQFMEGFSLQVMDKRSVSLGLVAQLSMPKSDQKVVNILNVLVERATKDTILMLSQQIILAKQARQRLIQHKIDGARQVEFDRRLDRLAQLDEAISVTKYLKMTKLVSSGLSLNINNMTAEGQNDGIPLYLLGSDLLEAEKRVLEVRKNDDAFIDDLRVWQEELQLIKSLKIESEKFGVVQVDQAAVFADKVSPKKALVLAVAATLGLMLGVFVALIRRANRNRKGLQEQALT